MYKSLDRMIELDKERMFGDPWMHVDHEHIESDGKGLSWKMAWDELHNVYGQIQYRGYTFVVNHRPAVAGFGGMDEGSPESIVVYRNKWNED